MQYFLPRFYGRQGAGLDDLGLLLLGPHQVGQGGVAGPAHASLDGQEGGQIQVQGLQESFITRMFMGPPVVILIDFSART